MLSESAPASTSVLLVDDDEELVDLLQNYLEREGFSVGGRTTETSACARR